MKKIAYLTGTRAEFGLMQQILIGIRQDKKLELKLLATGMHLMDQFGHTITDVDKQFRVKVIEAVFTKDDRESMARFLGKCTKGVVEELIKNKPEAVMVLGDRAEQLAMAQAAAYLDIPLIHLHGGEETTTVDDKARNAISQLSDWHLPASKKAKKKLIKMGLNKRKIKVVGAPGLDQLKDYQNQEKKFQIVVLQHPDESEDQAGIQVEKTLKAAVSFELPVQVIYPNADAGGRKMIKVIDSFKKKFPKLVKTHPSLSRNKYLKLLAESKVLAGNSSSSLIEAPSLGLAVVNIGPRQMGRERGNNVIDVEYNLEDIKIAMEGAMKMTGQRFKNPYGDGKTSKRVIKFLKRL